MSAVVHAAERGVGIALSTGESYCLVTRADDADRPAVRLLIGWMLQQFAAVA